MSAFHKIINTIHSLPQESLHRLEAVADLVEYPKGTLLFRSDTVGRQIYLIQSGLVRAFKLYDGNELTFWFGREGDPVLSMRSYVLDKPGYESIELLENSVLYRMDISALRELYLLDIEIANWGRKLAERELLHTEERFVSRQFKTATERYEELIKNQPDLLQRVQLGHLASYLGITQVSLSRIRTRIR